MSGDPDRRDAAERKQPRRRQDLAAVDVAPQPTTAAAPGYRERLATVNSGLLMAVVFATPFSAPASNIFAGLLLIGWLLRADFRNDWREARSNPVVIAAALFLALHGVGFLWSEHWQDGLAVLRKEWKFLLLPVFLCCARHQHVPCYLAAFVAAMALAVVISFGIWLQLLPIINRATVANPVPFATHVVYNPLLAVAIYIVARWLLFEAGTAVRRMLAAALLAAMTANMFITAGRAGQAAFLVAIVVLCVQYFGPSLRAAAVAVLLVATTLALAWAGSESFRHRLTAAVTGDATQGGEYDISIDERRAYVGNALSVIARHPWFGVGTGDLAFEMRRHHEATTPELRFRANPHSMYLLMLGQFGLLGLASVLGLFFVQLRHALATARPHAARHLGVALPIMFMVLCLAESYLAVHATALLFCVFSGFLYKRPGQMPQRRGQAATAAR